MATAKKRQAIPVLPLEVARDAIRLGKSPDEVVAATGEESKLALGLELLRAAIALLMAEGTWHINTYVHAASGRPATVGDQGGARSIGLDVERAEDVDRLYLALCAFRDPMVGGHGLQSAGHGDPCNRIVDDKTYRTATVSVGGFAVRVSSWPKSRCARKVGGEQCVDENGHEGEHVFNGKVF